MGNFNRGDNFGGNRRRDNDRGFRSGSRSGGRPEMHKAICAECGKECEVPFRPSGDKPVYCSNCFGNKEGGGNSRFERRDSSQSNFGEKKMFKAICSKCGKSCEVPFRPTGDKPVFCSDCFGKGERGGSGSNIAGSDKYQKQFDLINSKLDSIMRILSPKGFVEKTNKEVPAVKKAEPEKMIKETPAVKKAVKIAEKKIEVKKSKPAKKVIAPKKIVKKAAAKKKR